MLHFFLEFDNFLSQLISYKSSKVSPPNENNVGFVISSLLFMSSLNEDQICIGGQGGEIHLYKIDKEMKLTLSQKFPNEHNSLCISSLLDFDSNTLISSARSYIDPDSDTDQNSQITIVIWSKSLSSPLYKAKQRITVEETRIHEYVSKLVHLNNEDFASFSPCSMFSNGTIAIWTKERRDEEEEEQIFHMNKQEIIRKGDTCFLYILTTQEFIIGHSNSPFPSGHSIQIYSSSLRREQELETSQYSPVFSLVELSSKNKFASGHENGEINIWSKSNSRRYSHLKEIFSFWCRRPIHGYVSEPMISDLLFISELKLLIWCSKSEDTIVIYKIEVERGDFLKHDKVKRLIHLRNGAFASGGTDGCLRLWSPRFTAY
jgi:hypothetical protein